MGTESEQILSSTAVPDVVRAVADAWVEFLHSVPIDGAVCLRHCFRQLLINDPAITNICTCRQLILRFEHYVSDVK